MRFRSGTVGYALAQARAALGRDALVLSTTLVPVDGPRGAMGAREVELTATASEREAPEVSERRPGGRCADIGLPQGLPA